MQRVYQRVQSSESMEFVIKLTYAELYNEEIRDLLAPQDSQPLLRIVDDPALGPLIQVDPHTLAMDNLTLFLI